MIISMDRPITANSLVDFIRSLTMPATVGGGLFGVLPLKIGRMKADAGVKGFAHLVHAPMAVLARYLAVAELPMLPIHQPSPADFVETLTAAVPGITLREISLALGLEASAAYRWRHHICKRAYPAAATLMALVIGDGKNIGARWARVLECAQVEAAARGVDLFESGTWGGRQGEWIQA